MPWKLNLYNMTYVLRVQYSENLFIRTTLGCINRDIDDLRIHIVLAVVVLRMGNIPVPSPQRIMRMSSVYSV